MADSDLLGFFAGPVMTDMAQTMRIKRGLPKPLPDWAYTPSTTKSGIAQAKFKKFNGNRSLPPVVAYQSSSAQVEVPGSTWEYVTALGTKTKFSVDYAMLQALTSGVPYLTDNAMREFQKRMEDYLVYVDNFRTTVIHMLLLRGAVNIGTVSAGPQAGVGAQILNTSTSPTATAITTINTGVSGDTSSTFTHTTNWTNTSVAVGDWSSAGTDISGSLRAMRQGFTKTNGYVPTTILYGVNIPSYMATNTSLQTFMSRNGFPGGMGPEFLKSNEVPAGLMDFNWVPAYDAYFVDSSNNINTIIGPDDIVILPTADDNWYELLDVGTLIPTQYGVVSPTPEMIMSSYRPAYGKYAFSQTKPGNDPVGLEILAGDFFYPAVKTGLVQWIATTK